jgi:biopolymer transport protein ExbD
VVLVLLIIFMLTAHVMDYGLKVEVPKVKVTQETNEELPMVTISSDQKLQLNKINVNINDLSAQIERRFKGQKKVYVAADKSVRWDTVAQVMAELKIAQFEILAVTKPLELKGR